MAALESLTRVAGVGRLTERPSEPRSRRKRTVLHPLTGVSILVTAAWVTLFVLRVQAHQPSVDDYAYSGIAYQLLSHQQLGGLISAVYHTGSTSPLVPVLAAPLVHIAGVNGGTAVELPLLLLLVGGAYTLARIWLRPGASAATALVVGLNQAVLGYAVMLNFSVAVTGATLWSLAAYLRSDHLRRLRWSVLFGVAVAALALSRSLAPVYVVPLGAVVLVDLVVDTIRRRSRPWLPVAVAAGLILLLSGPWWMVSGPDALHYLRNAGYQVSSGYTYRGGSLGPSSLLQRGQYTLSDLGWPQSLLLGVAVAICGLLAVFRPRKLRNLGLGVPLAWAVLAFLLLSTSSNAGTGFGLPVLAVVIVVAAACIGQLQWRPMRLMTGAAVALLAVGFGAEVTGAGGNWWFGPPYRTQVLASGGTRQTNVESLTARVDRFVGTSPTLVARDDDLVNVNGLDWLAPGKRTHLLVPPNGTDATPVALRDVRLATFLIAGSTRGPYHQYLDEQAVETAAARDGFRPSQQWNVSPSNDIVIWQRGVHTGRGLTNAPLPLTRVLRPSQGAVLKGAQLLNASASGEFGVTRVEFRLTGGGLHDALVATAEHFEYGWLGAWSTAVVPNGNYTLRSVAYDITGRSGQSAGTVVQVSN